MEENILNVRELNAGYGRRRMLRDVSFSLKRGEILGIVGESGCGKSTLLKALIRQKDSGVVQYSGTVCFEGTDMSSLRREDLRRICGTRMGMIFQNPGMSFNAIRPYRKQFFETLKSHDLLRDKKMMEKRILDTFQSLKLEDAEGILDSCPYEMSGGMNQRIAIAMSMVLEPSLLLADEPTSALDVTVQMQVVEELLKMREIYNTAMILVTHNIGVVRKMADRVAILYAGRVVEIGSVEEVLNSPAHPYTRALLHAVPVLNGVVPQGLDGNPPANGADMDTCAFAERCEYCDGICNQKKPVMQKISEDHWAVCKKDMLRMGI